MLKFSRALFLGLTMAAVFVQSASSFAREVVFRSGIAEYDEAYRKAVRVIASDIKDNKFLAGESWAQVWTRDSSYSIDLACKMLHPGVSKNTLLGLVEHVDGIGTVWFQDVCGHFGGWPALSDAIVGALGAWSLYEYTGDDEVLRYGFEVTVNSLKRAERDVFDEGSSLFKGCSTFMESNSGYPKKYGYNGALLAQTKALSTNLLYYRGYVIAGRMAKLLNKDAREFEQKAERLKQAINRRFWIPAKGYYGYFEDENGRLYENMEGTGEAFAILFDVASEEQKQSILKHTPQTDKGIPSLWPQFPENKDYNKHFAEYYHNGMIWPFVQGYWGWAAASAKSLDVFKAELDKLTRNSQMNDTYMEFYRPEDARPDGSRAQLWSASGYLSMIYHGLFGMTFSVDGLRFAPVVPDNFSLLTLNGLVYRGMEVDLVIRGQGTKIRSFTLNGVPQDEAMVPSGGKGRQSIEIELER